RKEIEDLLVPCAKRLRSRWPAPAKHLLLGLRIEIARSVPREAALGIRRVEREEIVELPRRLPIRAADGRYEGEGDGERDETSLASPRTTHAGPDRRGSGRALPRARPTRETSCRGRTRDESRDRPRG